VGQKHSLAGREEEVPVEMTTLPKDRPSVAEVTELWRAWTEAGDVRARDRLVLSYAPMVKFLAFRKVRELPAHCDLDDLVSCGLLALIAAVDRFDPTKGSFESYAWTRVSGAMIDELRAQDWAPRALRRKGRAIDRAREKWTSRNGRFPTDCELAAELDQSVDELRAGLDGLTRADVLSLNLAVHTGDEMLPMEVGDMLAAPAGVHDPELSTLAMERSRVLEAAISELSEREQQVLRMRYVHHLPGNEIGRRLGISESRVSQILSVTYERLRKRIAADDVEWFDRAA
jgi:RNA polymerase sigma factor for flagellar operon FliA